MPLVLLGFWSWMFNDMLKNPAIPSSGPGGLSWPPQTKSQWSFVFVLLTIVAAGYYYLTEYQK
jgi:hypothetical protein